MKPLLNELKVDHLRNLVPMNLVPRKFLPRRHRPNLTFYSKKILIPISLLIRIKSKLHSNQIVNREEQVVQL